MSVRAEPDEIGRAAMQYRMTALEIVGAAESFPPPVRAGMATAALTGMLAQIAADAAARARRIADDAWDGEASEMFFEESSRHVGSIDELHTRILAVGMHFERISAELSWALADLTDIRVNAVEAGLQSTIENLADESGRMIRATLDLPPGTAYEQVRRTFGDARNVVDDLAAAMGGAARAGWSELGEAGSALRDLGDLTLGGIARIGSGVAGATS